MNLNVRNQFLFCAVSLLSLLVSCTSAPTPAAPSSPPPQPTASQAEPATPSPDSMLKAGSRYTDSASDMEVSFLDVVAFQATVDEEQETLEVVLQMRDIPASAALGQVRNRFEYLWMLHVYLDPTKVSSSDMDFYIVLNTAIKEPTADPTTPVFGTPVTVPIHELFEIKNTYDELSQIRSTPDVTADPDLDTLTITANVPGITPNAVFTFSTEYYDGSIDRPDNASPSQTTGNSTPVPETPQASQTSTTLTGDDTAQLIPAGTVRAYPGPAHYAGDILTFEIPTSNSFDETFTVSMTLDDMAPTEVQANFAYFFTGMVQIPLALDTTNLIGQHTVKFTTADGDLNETYSFEVLPAEQRPANETRAAWMVRETDCCIFHYISETAAARDIAFIAENFDQGAVDFESVMGVQIPAKMDVYILDRIWGNGGFGGNGELVISYTDRYYGPTIGSTGLQTLARHEFTHAANVGLDSTGDGIDFNSEGLAVYVAGGHYKPEPLAERGAALYDLGHYVPPDQFIHQHELSYLHAAVILTYIAEIYGEEKLWELFRADQDTPDEQFMSLGDAVQSTLGISLDDFDQGLQAWLESKEPGEQLDDLRLTVELQDLRRQYQDTYSPPPNIIFGAAAEGAARPELLPVVLREARAPSNIAIELIIANAQRAIVAGAYSEAEGLIQSISNVVSTGKFEDPVAAEYLNVVLAAQELGYEVLALNIQNGYATAQVAKRPPETSILELQKVNGDWQVRP